MAEGDRGYAASVFVLAMEKEDTSVEAAALDVPYLAAVKALVQRLPNLRGVVH